MLNIEVASMVLHSSTGILRDTLVTGADVPIFEQDDTVHVGSTDLEAFVCLGNVGGTIL